VCAANERWRKPCPRVPRPALRGGRDEGLHQLPVAINQIGCCIGQDCGSAGQADSFDGVRSSCGVPENVQVMVLGCAEALKYSVPRMRERMFYEQDYTLLHNKICDVTSSLYTICSSTQCSSVQSLIEVALVLFLFKQHIVSQVLQGLLRTVLLQTCPRLSASDGRVA
jgi:hypothetical protein